MAKFTCPYCYATYNKKEVLYVCPEANCAVDVVPKRTFSSKPPNCGTCGLPATTRRCPKGTHGPIPPALLDTPMLPFSIVGVPASGKTVYITAMIHELKRSRAIPFALSFQDDFTKMRQANHWEQLSERHIPPDSTAGQAPLPQVWLLQNQLRGDAPYTFTIFDGAGEDYENRIVDSNHPVTRYIGMSKSIILVLDPLTLSYVRRSGFVDKDILQNSLQGGEGEAKDAAQILIDMIQYIRRTNPKIGFKNKIPMIMAVVLTKFDTLLSHPAFREDALVKNSSLTIRDGKISMEEIDAVHEEIKDWLYDVEEGEIIKQLDTNIQEYKFFGVSSYGQPPTSAYEVPEIKSHRVLDPMLWLLKKAKFID